MGLREAAPPWAGTRKRAWGGAGLGLAQRGLGWAAPLGLWTRGLSGSFRKGPRSQSSGLQMESASCKVLGRKFCQLLLPFYTECPKNFVK